jgi:AcrR family transcriptional regulator
MTTQRTSGDRLQRSLDLLWGGDAPPARGPRPNLTLDRIVAAATALADREGIDAVSMRRLAGELGVGAMSLYRYIPGKAELLALMLDRVSAPGEGVVRAAEGAGWRDLLTAIARDTHGMYLRHPWLVQVNWTRPVMGPNTLAGLEHFMRALAGQPLSDQERVSLLVTIDGFVTGVARQQIQHAALAEETGVNDEEFWSRQEPVLSRAMVSGAYPAMAALSEDAFGLGWEETFEFGLQRILDGVAALIGIRQARPAPSGSGGAAIAGP